MFKEVEDEIQDIVLRGWQVYELKLPYLKSRTRHFIGYNPLTQDSHVSSPIIDWDYLARMGTSQSGHRYHLDDTRLDSQILDHKAVLDLWLSMSDAAETAVIDVSCDYGTTQKTGLQ